MRLVIHGGELIDQHGRRRADLAVADGRIIGVGTIEPGPADDVLDATGCLVSPGFVDIQVHFRTPGQTEAEDLASGARGAALGGFTAVVMMPNTTPCLDNVATVAATLAAAASLPCDIRSSAALSINRDGRELVDFVSLYDAGIRVFTDDGCALADPVLMRRALEAVRDLPGAVVSQHAEEPGLVEGGHINEGAVSARLGIAGRPVAAEEIIVARDIALARLTGARYHVLHLSSAAALDHVRRAKAEGLRVTAECTPQHLCLTEDDVERLGTSGKMNPPLRTAFDVAALRAGVADGTIDAIATDHAPHHPSTKAAPLDQAPPGMVGTETAAAVAFDELVHGGVCSPEVVLGALSWRPAALASVAGHGRPLQEGEPANITVFDPEERWVVAGSSLASKSVNTPFEGRELRGRVRHTVLGGRAVVRNGDLA